jgi:hypothetical protein
VITGWFLDIAAGFVGWFASLFSGFTVPQWFADMGTSMGGLLSGLNGLGGWIDWPVVSIAAASALATWAVCLGIKTVRAIASYIPFFGGAG